MDIPQDGGYNNDDEAPKRSGDELLMSREERMELLKELGYTKREIAASIRQVVHRKNQRRQTIQNLGAENVHLALEQAASKLRHVLLRSLANNRPSSSATDAILLEDDGGSVFTNMMSDGSNNSRGTGMRMPGIIETK